MMNQDDLIHQAQTAEVAGDFEQAWALWQRLLKDYPNDEIMLKGFFGFTTRLTQFLEDHGVDADQLGEAENLPLSRKILHPGYEFRKDLILARFKEQRIDAESSTVKEQKVLVVGSSDGIRLIESPSALVEVDSEALLLDLRYDAPASLERQWSRADLDRFIRKPTAPKGRVLFGKIVEALKRHLEFSDEGVYYILAAWVVLSFVYPAFPAVVFLLFLGPKGTGKTEALSTLGHLVRCGHKSRGTAAALGDFIATQRVIWLIDQANKLGDSLIQELVDSYKRDAKRTITDVDNRGKPHEFSTYGPKAFAAHDRFDEDLKDRCIQISTLPLTRPVEPQLADDRRLDEIRASIYRFAFLNRSKLFSTCAYSAREQLGQTLGFQGREWELWWPIEVVLEWMDVMPEQREAAREFYRTSIPSTKADISEDQRTVLEMLEMLEADGEELVVNSANFSEVMKCRRRWVAISRIGSILSDFQLVRDKSRITIEGRKVMEWEINTTRLRKLLDAWKVRT